MSSYRIPFNKPGPAGNEWRYMSQALSDGHSAGDGMFTRKCSALLEELLGARKVLLTTSCTHALEMAALLLDIKPGDEVVVPSFTFVSTVNAFVLRGARPVFVDIRPDTLNLDERRLERSITSRTRAILAVHYAGVACEMDPILAIAERLAVPVVEDNAHGLFGKYRGRSLGALGALATQSFHETKNIICGEGGALVINAEQYVKRAEIIRQKGTDRSRFLRGQVDKYTWIDIGSNYSPSDILAAFLFGQLEARVEIQAKRKAIWTRYSESLGPWAARNRVGIPSVPAHCEQPFHMFYLVMRSSADRQSLIDHLKSRSILSVFHYQPLHLSAMGRKFGGRDGDCPVTERISDCLVRLPFYADLTEQDQSEVIDAVLTFPVGSRTPVAEASR
jgi:dTDP-4-amino-4,6-dideoxygalactose transaminase